MGFLGQGLQRSTRDSLGTLQFVGMDVVSVAGAFSWPVPQLVDAVDIIAVGTGGGSFAAGSEGGSGSVAMRIAKPVVPGMVISGNVGAQNIGLGGSTTVDGMVAPGGDTGAAAAIPTGGDINLSGRWVNDTRVAIPSLAPFNVGGLRLIEPLLPQDQFGANNGVFPGGGSYSVTNTGYYGGVGGVFFIMYRRAS